MDRRIRRLMKLEFDSAFYQRTYGSIGKSRTPFDHFLTIGWIQGRDPSPSFSVLDYLARNDDVRRRRINPLLHYIESGRSDGRQCYPHSTDLSHLLPTDQRVVELLPLWFDEEFYLAVNPDLHGAPNALMQFLVLGWIEGRDPCNKFSTHKYLWKYADVWASGANPVIHFLQDGQAEGRENLPVEGPRDRVQREVSEAEWLQEVEAQFDGDFYLRLNPSVSDAPNLFEHYRTVGWLERRDPNANFSVSDYIAFHNDVRNSGVEPLAHYVRHGILEGRKTFPSKAIEEAENEVALLEMTREDEKLRAEFDAEFYRSAYPELSSLEDCFGHYMAIGWKEGKDPSSDFSTRYYLKNEGDIREAGINPFRHFVLHGRREGRRGTHRVPKLSSMTDYPRVSVIVPNFNHARFLRERLSSIVSQDYPNLELLLLDDCSSDNSRELLSEFAASYEGDCKILFNDINSGNVFSQWQKGLALASGELIWICESDDTCDAQFLQQIVYLFQDPSVRLAFGNIQFMDLDGNVLEGMDGLRESAQPGIWNEVNLMPAAKWFTGPLGVRNLMANVGGVVFRKPYLDAGVWAKVAQFKVIGDWFLYLMMAGGGQIAYAPDAKAYFRQHGSNTSVMAFDKVSFYEELGKFHTILRQRWAVPSQCTFNFYNNLLEIFENSKLARTHAIADIVSLDELLDVMPKTTHVAVTFLNFNIGGGEIFPVELLNVLHQRGVMVSAVVQTLASDNAFVRSWLHPAIPVYAASESALTGPELARDAQFNVIHSHNIWSEFHFVKENAKLQARYIATLHGSYEVSHVKPHQIRPFFDKVSWVYIATRNVEFFERSGFDVSSFNCVPNGFVRRLSASPVTRESLGITQGATVFLFAARSHPEKGWMQAAEAFDRLPKATGKDSFLLMAGEGNEPDRVKEKYAQNDRIKVLGFRSDVDDLLTVADFMLLPTRFAGESMPLTLIQSVLAGVPIISTNVGQIADMLYSEMGSVGVAVEPSSDDEVFVCSLLREMKRALGGKLEISQDAFRSLAKRFSMKVCAEAYLQLYGIRSAPRRRRPVLQGVAQDLAASEYPNVHRIGDRMQRDWAPDR